MKVIVAGGRDFTDMDKMYNDIMELIRGGVIPKDFELVCGMARGADMTAYKLCKFKGNSIYEFPANWDKFGKSAGHLRNKDMGDFADILVAFWDGRSKGTQGMIGYMEGLGKPVYVFRY